LFIFYYIIIFFILYINDNKENCKTNDRRKINDYIQAFNDKIIDDENWLPYQGCDIYEMSDYGRFKNNKTKRFMKPYFNNTMQFTVCQNAKAKKLTVAKEVYRHFKPEEY
jgi:hypothetical protein